MKMIIIFVKMRKKNSNKYSINSPTIKYLKKNIHRLLKNYVKWMMTNTKINI